MKKKIIYLFLVVLVSLFFYGCNNKDINQNDEASSVGVIGGKDKDTTNLSDTNSMDPDEIINFNSLINSKDVTFDKNVDRNNFIGEEENCINSFGTYETEDGNTAIAKSVISFNKIKERSYEIKYLVYGSTNEILESNCTLNFLSKNGNVESINLEISLDNPNSVLEKKFGKQIELSEYKQIDVSNIYIKTASGRYPLVSLNKIN